MNSHKEHREEFEKNQQWFIMHFQDIIKKYRDKFVAIWNQKVIETDKDLEILSQNVRKKTKGAKGVYIGFASDKPVEMIL
ncbi:MAG: hypothetical protein KKA79_00260 [Nanoarchaeota archaeon]|nr:hypothetical protein [Euryarchaeota archaeon]MBU4500995.1 hypothetical protein [Nanoarchaeota archaeon]MCG2727271.1 DUF5678 domain-containing protein [Candidatus Methanoperedenaceae archaeon]